MDGTEDDFGGDSLDSEASIGDLEAHIDSMLDAEESANSGASGDNTSEGGLAEQAQKLAESQQPTPPQQQQQTPDDDIAAIAEPEGHEREESLKLAEAPRNRCYIQKASR